jgi:hypothetical protein
MEFTVKKFPYYNKNQSDNTRVDSNSHLRDVGLTYSIIPNQGSQPLLGTKHILNKKI